MMMMMMMMLFGGAVSRAAPIGWLNKPWVVKHLHGSPWGACLLSCIAGVAADSKLVLSRREGNEWSWQQPGKQRALPHPSSMARAGGRKEMDAFQSNICPPALT